jgi:DNA (cytosine-5)-methyltransferase 1
VRHEQQLTHIDLFSGIGGFALAAGWAGFRTVAFCEIEPFCQEVLAARFGAASDTERQRGESREIYKSNLYSASGGGKAGSSSPDNENRPVLIGDIRTFDGTRFRGATLLTGGFPCQPFSAAGKRRGKADDRHLWPEMLRIVSEARPAWVVGENVAGIVNMELENVCADLEAEGYEVQPIIIPACAVNAPHRRDRVWICGHARELGLPRINGRRPRKKPTHRHIEIEYTKDDAPLNELSSRNAIGSRKNARSAPSRSRDPVGEPDSDAPDAEKRGWGQKHQDTGGESEGVVAPEEQGGSADAGWGLPWIEVATRLCRADDGLPAWVHSRRVARLKALGNAIVPQVAYQIIKAIADIERGKQ